MLLTGVAKKEITAPLSVGLLTSSVEGTWAPFLSVRKPLTVKVLVIKYGNEKIAVASLDLLGLTDTSVGGWPQFKKSLSDTFAPEKIVVHCTHTHNAPESVGLTDLHRSPDYISWLKVVRAAIFECVATADMNASACVLEYGCEELQKFSLQRRVATEKGMVISDSLQPIPEHLFARQPVDRRIRSLKFTKPDETVIATLVHAVCHPVHEMCIPEISPDFPGELCSSLHETRKHGLPVFLNGTAGDINPPTVSGGKNCSRTHGIAIADKVRNMHFRNIKVNRLIISQRELILSSRPMIDPPSPANYVARISVVALGELALVFLPGEPFVQTGLQIERHSPFKFTIVAGYCENSIGYVPPDYAFIQGGYEAGPGKWSYVGTDSETRIVRTACEMLDELKSGE